MKKKKWSQIKNKMYDIVNLLYENDSEMIKTRYKEFEELCDNSDLTRDCRFVNAPDISY